MLMRNKLPTVVMAMLFVSVLPTTVTGGPNASGQAIYEQVCAVCHGPGGEGAMPGVPDMTAGNGVLNKPEAELVRNTVQGMQSPDSPMAMPPMGGGQELVEKDIVDAIHYMRTTFQQGSKK